MCTVDYSSVLNITDYSEHTVFYGYDHCKYRQIADLCTSAGNPIYNYYLFGYNTPSEKALCKLYSSTVNKEPSMLSNGGQCKDGLRSCKANLVNLIFENYKRAMEGQPIIQLVFCIDIDDNPFPPKSEYLTNRYTQDTKRRLITFSELRRAYKLCCEFSNDEIRKVASETFRFVKVSREQGDKEWIFHYSLTKVDAPWSNKDWESLWKIREANPSTKETKRFPWKKELQRLIDEYHKSRSTCSSTTAATSSSSSSSSSSPSLSSSSSTSSPPIPSTPVTSSSDSAPPSSSSSTTPPATPSLTPTVVSEATRDFYTCAIL